MLREKFLSCWFPRALSEDGIGFRQGFDQSWNPIPYEDRFLVYQSRLTWVAGAVYMHAEDLQAEYLPYLNQGIRCLLLKMADPVYGGFFASVPHQGEGHLRASKDLYSTSFAMYGLAMAFLASGDERCLAKARDTLEWLDKYAHDHVNGGYHERFERDGTPATPDPGHPNILHRHRYKTMNAHLHLLEALTEMLRVREDLAVRQRLEEVLGLFLRRIAVPPGCTGEVFTEDWRGIPGPTSFGHNVETAFLMVEAAETLGRSNDPVVLPMAKSLVDHALAYGFSPDGLGLFSSGFAFGQVHSRERIWWVQVEALPALLLMHRLYGDSTDAYLSQFLTQWQYIKDHFLDSSLGGLYGVLADDGVTHRDSRKAHRWKAAYHDGRAMMTCSRWIRSLANANPG